MEREQPKAITDERFAAAQSDPRFMGKESMVEIESRFQRLFIDRSFASFNDSASTRMAETRRLAVVELDWICFRAVDIYWLLSSFLPKKRGQILSVAVYPSEFGLERMQEEAVSDGDNDATIKKKLLAYELNKLRYYYAVVECDSTATADYLYLTCHGVEFDRSSNKLDLIFIPDSMEFKHQPRDVAHKPAEYDLNDILASYESKTDDISKRILEKKNKKKKLETVSEAFLRKRKENKKAPKGERLGELIDDFFAEFAKEPCKSRIPLKTLLD